MARAIHPFLKARGIKEAFMVMRIDDYRTEHCDGDRGGFMTPNYGQKGGMLWPTEQMAIDAARHMVKKNPEQQYAVFKMCLVVETQHPPLTVVRV